MYWLRHERATEGKSGLGKVWNTGGMPLFSKALPSPVLTSLTDHLQAKGHQGRPRVLAWTTTTNGFLAGTPDVLAVLDDEGWHTWGWHELLRATWSDDGTSFTWVDLANLRSATVTVTEPGRLPDLVMERIEQTIVVVKPVVLARGRRGTLTGRRPADGSSDVTWRIIPGPGVDLSDPAQAEAASELIARAQRDWS